MKYYYDFLKLRNFKIILHDTKNESNYNKSLEILNKYNITPEIILNYSSIIKCEKVNSFLSTLHNDDWLIYPDLDEFFSYPNNNIFHFLEECEKNKISVVRGTFFDRINEKFYLKKLNITESIWSQYPYHITNNGISKCFGASYHKICACKAKFTYNNSHWLNEELFVHNPNKKKFDVVKYINNGNEILNENIKYYKYIIPVYHFRCDDTLYYMLKHKLEKQNGYNNIQMCQDFYKKIFQNIIIKNNQYYLLMNENFKLIYSDIKY
jgi:hypothetical protein